MAGAGADGGVELDAAGSAEGWTGLEPQPTSHNAIKTGRASRGRLGNKGNTESPIEVA